MRNSLFQSDWWMNAVTDNNWKQIEIKKNDSTIAIWPYIEKKEGFGMKIISQPSLTQTTGPWMKPSSSKIISKRTAHNRKLLVDLIEKLPEFDFFHQRFHYTLQYLLPFHWAGFQISPCYTYLINDLSDLDTIWSQTNQSVRTDVRKAQKVCSVEVDLSFDDFWKVYMKTWKRQGISCPYPYEYVKKIDSAAIQQGDGARKILFAVDERQNIHAAIYLVYDKKCTYYLLGGSDPAYRNSGANSLLVWKGIEFASTVSQMFDFEGSMAKQIERKFAAFGAQPQVYFDVRKMSPKYKALSMIKKIVQKLK